MRASLIFRLAAVAAAMQLALAGAGCGGTARRLLGDIQSTFPPADELTVTPAQAFEGEKVTFNVVGDIKALDSQLAYSWDFGSLAEPRRYAVADPEVTLARLDAADALTETCHVSISYSIGQQVETVEKDFQLTILPLQSQLLPQVEKLEVVPKEVISGQPVVLTIQTPLGVDPSKLTFQWDLLDTATLRYFSGNSPTITPVYKPGTDYPAQPSVRLSFDDSFAQETREYSFDLTVLPPEEFSLPAGNTVSVTPVTVFSGQAVDIRLLTLLQAPADKLSYSWDFGDAATPRYSTNVLPAITPVSRLDLPQPFVCSLTLTLDNTDQNEVKTYSFELLVKPTAAASLPPEGGLLITPLQVNPGSSVDFGTDLALPAGISAEYFWDFGDASDTRFYYIAAPQVVLKRWRTQVTEGATPAAPPNYLEYAGSVRLTLSDGLSQQSRSYPFQLRIQKPDPLINLLSVTPLAVTENTNASFSYVTLTGDVTGQLWNLSALGDLTDPSQTSPTIAIRDTPAVAAHQENCKLTLYSDTELFEYSFKVTVNI